MLFYFQEFDINRIWNYLNKTETHLKSFLIKNFEISSMIPTDVRMNRGSVINKFSYEDTFWLKNKKIKVENFILEKIGKWPPSHPDSLMQYARARFNTSKKCERKKVDN